MANTSKEKNKLTVKEKQILKRLKKEKKMFGKDRKLSDFYKKDIPAIDNELLEKLNKLKSCDKCKKKNLTDIHHVLPQSNFESCQMNQDDLVNLCPNCHREYHYLLGRKNLSIGNKIFHRAFYTIWVCGMIVMFFLIVGGLFEKGF